ncbi:hypothetical protein K439DRAFT_1639815 [Ramaria rubella]|nr:hypothetical protein K439DRAFT_1639815 [Ramaria rubella]
MTSNQLRSPWNFTWDRSVSFTPWVNGGGNYAHTALMKRPMEEWRHANIFESVLKGWSDEAVPIYHHENTAFDTRSPGTMVAFSVERASLPLFGLANFGCLIARKYTMGINELQGLSRFNFCSQTFVLPVYFHFQIALQSSGYSQASAIFTISRSRQMDSFVPGQRLQMEK